MSDKKGMMAVDGDCWCHFARLYVALWETDLRETLIRLKQFMSNLDSNH